MEIWKMAPPQGYEVVRYMVKLALLVIVDTA